MLADTSQNAAIPVPSTSTLAVAKTILVLQDPDKSVRLRALQDLQAAAYGKYKAADAKPACLTIGREALRRFDDASERCRELACTIVDHLVQEGQYISEMLPYIVPVLLERLERTPDSPEPREKSEEVRLQLHRLVLAVITAGNEAGSCCAAELVDLLVSGWQDPFHAVNMQACQAAAELARRLGPCLPAELSKRLVAACLPVTTHRRCKVRAAAVQALQPLMHCGAYEMILDASGWADPNSVPISAFYGTPDTVINYAGKLATDASPQVRMAWVDAAGDWLHNLRERHDAAVQGRLLPYVLGGLTDSNATVAATAAEWVDRLGALYESDHKRELEETLHYLAQDGDVLGWLPEQVVSRIYAPPGGGPAVVPPQFAQRPRLGARMLVHDHFHGLGPALAAEACCASNDTARRPAALLLCSCLVFVEGNAAGQFRHILPAFCQVMQDKELQDVRPIVEQSCRVIGCATAASQYSPFLVPAINDAASDPASRAAAVHVLTACLEGSRLRSHSEDSFGVITAAVDFDSLCQSHDIRLQAAMTRFHAALTLFTGSSR